VHEVDPEAPATVAGLLGCGVMAGIGAAINTGGVGRGDSVAVFGCGGVGDAAIAGALLAGATTIIGVDIDDRKLDGARAFGATHTVNSRDTDPVAAIQELTGGNGVDVAIEAVGLPEVYEQAFYARDLAGTVVLVGVPAPEMTLDAAVPRRVRPRRGAEVLLVRRLPADAGLPDADRAVPAGRLPWTSSSPRRSGSTTSRPRSRRCTRVRCSRSVVVRPRSRDLACGPISCPVL
jgi:S-(hydroxymethyl)mycothiol dehydrogenase